jgi:hypothetical protein
MIDVIESDNPILLQNAAIPKKIAFLLKQQK